MPKTKAQELNAAVQLYLDLMYDCDVEKFDRVFWPSAQLHGFRGGEMTCWPVAEYKQILAERTSPKALDAPREEEILMLDFASPTTAMAKLQVRINDMVFIDYLTYHWIDGKWLITAKGYHLQMTS
jgi:hypothetical protein